MPILFDTGALELLRRRNRHAEKLAIDFFPPVVCTSVLGEFLYGQLLAEVSSRGLLDVQEFLAAFDVQHPDSSIALIYARLRSDQKRRGVVRDLARQSPSPSSRVDIDYQITGWQIHAIRTSPR